MSARVFSRGESRECTECREMQARAFSLSVGGWQSVPQCSVVLVLLTSTASGSSIMTSLTSPCRSASPRGTGDHMASFSGGLSVIYWISPRGYGRLVAFQVVSLLYTVSRRL